MSAFIDDTLQIAQNKFKSFGFKDEQIEQLLTSGRKDLVSEFDKLKVILIQDEIDIKLLNDSLHALKGLLLNMGNDTLANNLIELKNNQNIQDKIDNIKSIFEI